MHPVAAVLGDLNAPSVITEIVFQCPLRQCSRLFIGRYVRTGHGLSAGHFLLHSTTPTNAVPPPVAKEIGEVSPSFVTIYSQASEAEALRLDQIAGVGYRKALEFLIKDYCVSLQPSDTESIHKEPLAATITTRVSDSHVKECARRATWLGNDQTHYTRKWGDKDITDLKTLIELTMNWIRSSVLTQRYLKDMSEPRK